MLKFILHTAMWPFLMTFVKSFHNWFVYLLNQRVLWNKISVKCLFQHSALLTSVWQLTTWAILLRMILVQFVNFHLRCYLLTLNNIYKQEVHMHMSIMIKTIIYIVQVWNQRVNYDIWQFVAFISFSQINEFYMMNNKWMNAIRTLSDYLNIKIDFNFKAIS